MLRLRLYRLALPLTVLGLDLWSLFLVAFGVLISLGYWQDRVPNILVLPLSGAAGYALMQVVGLVKRLFPGRALLHMMTWLTQGDHYVVRRDAHPMPLIVPEVDRFMVRPSRKPAKPGHRALPKPDQAPPLPTPGRS